MDMVTLVLALSALCSLLCALLLVYRVFSPAVVRLFDAANEANGMENRIFPLVAFAGLVAILLKLTLLG